MAKRVTSQDVADLAGVSRTTVSFVLNNVTRFNITPQTRQKVLDAAESLGYVPNASAQALASRRAKAIGLVMTRSPRYIASDTFLPQIIGGLLDVVKSKKLGLLIEWVEPGRQLATYRGLVNAKHIDGMILLTPRLDDDGLKELEDFDVPTILMGELPGSNLYSVDVDNRLAAQKVVGHLVDLGHRDIACILNAPPPYSSATERLLGYQDALEAANIPFNNQLVRHADFDPASGYKQMQALLTSAEPFSAVFTASDNVTIGVLSAIRDAGKLVPDDLSVAGFDDIPWAAFSDPPLTTIRMPAQELAHHACYLLLDLMQGQIPENKHMRLETELVIRKSTQAFTKLPV